MSGSEIAPNRAFNILMKPIAVPLFFELLISFTVAKETKKKDEKNPKINNILINSATDKSRGEYITYVMQNNEIKVPVNMTGFRRYIRSENQPESGAPMAKPIKINEKIPDIFS